jgi:hypothetical protein
MGAKSSCVFVSTRDVKLIIDPGIAIMHRGFPASDEWKLRWLSEGFDAIVRYLNRSTHVVISHYHYDHYFPDSYSLYGGKVLFVKNPNIYINDSQRERAFRFFSGLYREHLHVSLESVLIDHEKLPFTNPLKDIPHAMSLDLGDYTPRRLELLEKGLSWFKKRVENWNNSKFIPELKGGNIQVNFADNKKFQFGETIIRFTYPLFHGIEFSRVGWVYMTIVENGKRKLLHSSDVNGPIIEDYADLIIREDPDVLILDGPMTYMLGYTLNITNLKRVKNNIIRIIENTKTNPIILDHHLPREKKFKEKLKEIYKTAEKTGKEVLTAAEYYGQTPVVLKT